jgi:murein DD-endopeptidase MepM/ murein hydrolase activator NlpD
VRKLAAALVAVFVLIPVAASAEVTQGDLQRAWDEVTAISADLEDELAALDAVQIRQWQFEDRVAALQRDIEERDRQIALTEVAARERAVALYVNYGTRNGPAAISVEDVTESSTRDAYLDALVDEDRDVVVELEFLQQDREQLIAELEAVALQQEDVRVEVELLAEQINRRLAEANDEYQALWEQWQREEAERIRRAEEERQRQEAARLAAEAAARAAAAAASGYASSEHIPAGTRICPVAGPNTFRNSWGEPRSGGRGHAGVDIVAATGVPLVAIESGTIYSPNWHYLGGIGLYLRGDSGDVYYYAHMASYGPGISDGVRVGAGQVVGYVGTTGNAATPHLHLGYQPGGGPLTNPYQLMVKLCR